MITIFAIPKPFNGHIGVIQANAILSWLNLQPLCQVILFGDEEGVVETTKELGVQHVPDVKRNEFGTPLLDQVFRTVHKIARHDVLCYINADIILMSDFVDAIQIVRKGMRRFLIVGQRWNADISEPLNFKNSDWEEQLKAHIMECGQLYGLYGMDYFAFSRSLFRNIPPFAVGRATWDNWMVYAARRSFVPVVDITSSTNVVHQNHDYSHLPKGEEEVYRGIEAKRNSSLAGGPGHIFGVKDATYTLTSSGLRLDLSYEKLKRHLFRLCRLLILSPYTPPMGRLIRLPAKTLKLLRLYSPQGETEK